MLLSLIVLLYDIKIADCKLKSSWLGLKLTRVCFDDLHCNTKKYTYHWIIGLALLMLQSFSCQFQILKSVFVQVTLAFIQVIFLDDIFYPTFEFSITEDNNWVLAWTWKLKTRDLTWNRVTQMSFTFLM